MRPSEEHLRKQAKRMAKRDGLSLADAQHRLAREYGAKHWAELMATVATMLRGADRLEYPQYDFEALPAAANAGDLDRVRAVLASGEFTQHDLDLALARAVLRFDEREAIARLLVEHGADPDGQYGAAYGPIVLVTGEALDVGGLAFLIEVGCDVTFAPVATKFGPQSALTAWLGSYLRGRNEAKRRGIDLLLAHGAPLPSEITPARLATHRDDPAALARALDAEPGARDALMTEARALGATACIELLIDRGALGWIEDDGLRHAVACIDRGAVEELRELLCAEPRLVRARADGDSPDSHAYFRRPTLLHFIANNPNRGARMPPRSVEMARAILEAGAEVDAVTDGASGGTTLGLVASSAPARAEGVAAPLLELLVAQGADPGRGVSAAMLHRYPDNVRTLLALGARHTAVTAAGLGDASALRDLIAAGVSDGDRLRAGWAAAMNGQTATLELLLAAGLHVDARLPRAFAPTMLHEAGLNGHRATCERLLAHGADPTLRDREFEGTAADWARHGGHTELAELLAPPP